MTRNEYLHEDEERIRNEDENGKRMCGPERRYGIILWTRTKTINERLNKGEKLVHGRG